MITTTYIINELPGGFQNDQEFLEFCSQECRLDFDAPTHHHLGLLTFWPNTSYPMDDKTRMEILTARGVKFRTHLFQYGASQLTVPEDTYYYTVPPDTQHYLRSQGLEIQEWLDRNKSYPILKALKTCKVEDGTYKLVVLVDYQQHGARGRWWVSVELYKTQPGHSKHGRRKTLRSTIAEYHSWTRPLCWPSIDAWIRDRLDKILPHWPKE